MTVPLDVISNLQALFRLDFLFSGLEVSSTEIFYARLSVFALTCLGVIWCAAQLTLKAMDCVRTFLRTLPRLSGYFLLALVFMAPLSHESLGVRWMGSILAITALLMVLGTAACLAILWRYGVDQVVRLLRGFRSPRSTDPSGMGAHHEAPPESPVT
jgi:hypothetical protein